jgi:hypothetical protein
MADETTITPAAQMPELRGDFSPSIGKLALALSKAQAAITNATKSKDNPYFKSHYADLAAVLDVCRQPLAANELAVIQSTENEGEQIIVTTLLAHSSGEWARGRVKLKPVKNDPQSVGSAITYGRRYGLSAAVGVAAEDDDGNAAARGQVVTPESVKVPGLPPPAVTQAPVPAPAPAAAPVKATPAAPAAPAICPFGKNIGKRWEDMTFSDRALEAVLACTDPRITEAHKGIVRTVVEFRTKGKAAQAAGGVAK